MAVAVRAITSLALSNRTNSTLTAPAGLANNDILLCVMVAGDGGDTTAPTVTPPTGFAELTGFPLTVSKPDPYAIALHVFWKLAASESGSYVFSHGAADSEGMLYALSGADATPINPAATTATGTGTSLVIGGLTTPNNSALVVCAACAWDAIGAGAVPPTGTTPTFTERYDPGTGGVLYVSDGVLATAGATGDKTQLLPGNNGGTPPGSSPNAGGLVCIEADTGGGGRTTRNAHPSGLGMQHGMGMTLPNGGRYL